MSPYSRRFKRVPLKQLTKRKLSRHLRIQLTQVAIINKTKSKMKSWRMTACDGAVGSALRCFLTRQDVQSAIRHWVSTMAMTLPKFLCKKGMIVFKTCLMSSSMRVSMKPLKIKPDHRPSNNPLCQIHWLPQVCLQRPISFYSTTLKQKLFLRCSSNPT